MALANTREQLLMSVSARCTKYHIQDCLNCNDVECGDNMNPLKSKIQSLREALQWAMGFPKCTCYDPDNRGQEQTCNCGHAANVQKALATLEAAKKI